MLLRFLAILQVFVCTIIATPTSFNITAISATNGTSNLECWQLSEHLVSMSSKFGIIQVQQLGNLANASWTSFPAHYVNSAHPAPIVQYAVILSGLAIIQIPESNQKASFQVGRDSLYIAADTADITNTGHITIIGNEELTALEIPTAGGKVPAHLVLHGGACLQHDMTV